MAGRRRTGLLHRRGFDRRVPRGQSQGRRRAGRKFLRALEGVAAPRGRDRGLPGVRMGCDRARAGARQGQDHRARHDGAHRGDHGAQGFRHPDPAGPAQRADRGHLAGRTQAAALMEPLVSRAAEAGARTIADLRWRGGIVAGDDVDDETAGKIMRALNRAVAWLAENEDRSREELLRDLKPELRKSGLLPELSGVQSYKADEFQEKVDWMMRRGFLEQAPTYAETVRGK